MVQKKEGVGRSVQVRPDRLVSSRLVSTCIAEERKAGGGGGGGGEQGRARGEKKREIRGRGCGRVERSATQIQRGG